MQRARHQQGIEEARRRQEQQADRMGQRLHIDPVDWYRAQDTPKFLREVADAVWQGRRLTPDYESWRGAAQRELEPLGLVLKAGAWYVLARTVGSVGSDGERTYRLASILALKAVGRSFKRPRGLKWLSNGRIRVLKLPAGTSTKTTRSGWCELLLLIESIEHGARQLLSFGAEVEVIEPAALSSAVLKQARGVVALYPRTAR